MKEATIIVVLTIALIALVVLAPLATIWALNTLFPILAIEYSISTWIATVLLGMFFRANVNVSK